MSYFVALHTDKTSSRDVIVSQKVSSTTGAVDYKRPGGACLRVCKLSIFCCILSTAVAPTDTLSCSSEDSRLHITCPLPMPGLNHYP